MNGNHEKQGNPNQRSSSIYHCFICNSLKHKVYEYPHKLVAQEMFQDKVSHAKPKKDQVVVNMVLVVEMKS
jgi:hypothetical protein